jgi:hypothetical protein
MHPETTIFALDEFLEKKLNVKQFRAGSRNFSVDIHGRQERFLEIRKKNIKKFLNSKIPST